MGGAHVPKQRLLAALLLVTVASFISNASYIILSMKDTSSVEYRDPPQKEAMVNINKLNSTYLLLKENPIPSPSSPKLITSFSPWMQEYIAFHRSSIINGKLKDDTRYIIYQCKDGNIRCGGAGDRLMAMIKILYLAICTRRVLLIDSTFPIPLASVLNAGHIEWNATYPETNEVFDDLELGAPLQLRTDIRGYRINRTNGNIPQVKKSVNAIWNEFVKDKYLYGMEESYRRAWTSLADKMPLGEVIHEAFWALFTFDPVVVARAKELTLSTNTIDPYVGLHLRTGDEAFGIEGARKLKRGTSSDDLLTCYNFLRGKYPNAFKSAYLASDNLKEKEDVSKREPTIQYAKDLSPFHIDLIARNENNRHAEIQSTDGSALQGTIDTWAEILVLAQSTFLTVSRSMFSFAAHYMRYPEACSVYLDQCLKEATGTGQIVYYGEVVVGDLPLITNTRCI